MIKSLAHVCIKTTDLGATSRFYCGLLGMEKLFHFTRKGEVIGFYLKASRNSFIEVFEAKELALPDGDRNPHHFCLETENIEALRAALLEGGGKPGEVKQGCDRSWQFWIKDPNGVDVEFHQYTDQSAQFRGQDVEVDW